jgi:hypothetical protein
MEQDVIINGVWYIPDPAHADEVKFYYMHDNHTFSRLNGTTIDDVLEGAEAMAKESRCGMLCPPILLVGGKEVRRLKAVAHAPCCDSDDSKWLAGIAEWKKECEADSCVMRLVSSNAELTGRASEACEGVRVERRVGRR